MQLGGSDPSDLAKAAVKAQEWGYDQIDLNCGCPSERVQKGSFGACLMAEPELVAQCVSAMRDAVSIPISVKHRLGLNSMDQSLESDYQFAFNFMYTFYFIKWIHTNIGIEYDTNYLFFYTGNVSPLTTMRTKCTGKIHMAFIFILYSILKIIDILDFTPKWFNKIYHDGYFFSVKHFPKIVGWCYYTSDISLEERGIFSDIIDWFEDLKDPPLQANHQTLITIQ